MHALTLSEYCSGFLVSISPALSALLSATALWVASRARSTSKDAQQTSQDLRKTFLPPAGGHSVIVSEEVVRALRSASSKGKGSKE